MGDDDLRPLEPALPSRRCVLHTSQALAAAGMLAALAGCSTSPAGSTSSPATAGGPGSAPAPDGPTGTPSATGPASSVARASSAFSARQLAQRLRKSGTSNALLSPAGTSLTLAMLYTQADKLGDGVAHLLLGPEATLSAAERDTRWQAVLQSLQRLDTADTEALKSFKPDELPDTPLLHVANNLVQVGSEQRVRTEYVEAVRSWYGATVSQVPPEEAQEVLDDWARLHTGGLIDKSGIQVNPDTVMVLQNALLLSARWLAPFDATNTLEQQDFRRLDGSHSQATLMEDTRLLPLVTSSEWRAVRLPYTPGPQGENLAMDIVLPDHRAGLQSLPASTWQEATEALSGPSAQEQQVLLRLPRLDLHPEPADLLQELRQLGISLDHLKHIGDGLAVDQAVQQVRLQVQEAGTVGAALTEAGISKSAAGPEPVEPEAEFIADHPFVLRVVELGSGLAVFEAAVMDPASAAAG